MLLPTSIVLVGVVGVLVAGFLYLVFLLVSMVFCFVVGLVAWVFLILVHVVRSPFYLVRWIWRTATNGDQVADPAPRS